MGLQRHHSLFLDSMDGTHNRLPRGYTPGRTQVVIYYEGGPQGGINHPHLQLDPKICPQDESPEQTNCPHSNRLRRQISVSKHIPTFPI